MYLRDALDRGATVVTANLRAARALESAYAEDQSALSAAWPTPHIVDWASWVSELWEQDSLALHAGDQAEPPLPLTMLQEHQLWQRVQGADRARVVAPDRMADLAQQAYKLLGDYAAHPLRRAATASLFGATHEDAERFLVWAAAFDRLCGQNRWISSTRLEEMLAASIDRTGATQELCLVGFDRTTPAQAVLLDACERAGSRVSRYAPEIAASAAPRLVQAAHAREELEACAWWCRAQLGAGTRRVGIIAPELERMRAELDRVFRRILMPQTTLWDASEAAMPYEFSLGSPLAQLPLVRAALLVLSWPTSPIATAELTWLLTSGFLADSPGDRAALAQLDAALRREGRGSPRVSLARLIDRQARRLPGGLAVRLARLRQRATHEGLGGTSTRQSYAHWAELVPALLADVGWPGWREVDSFAYQVQQRWTRLLSELAELGFDGSQPTWAEFLETLASQAHQVIFAAESRSAPIQILGAFESSGQSFDAVWFLGVDDQHWPAVGRPHPMLPVWLQRDAKMPHATPEADSLLAQQTTERIVASAPIVVLSYSLQEQAVALRASPLALAAASDAPATPAAEIVAQVRDAAGLEEVALEAVEDDSGLIPWPAGQTAGGADILKRQAACAFQSFAMRRLEARPLEAPEEGLDTRERGTLLHDVLARLWSESPATSARLHTLADLEEAMRSGNVTMMVTNAIREVFAARSELPGSGDDLWQAALLANEQERVQERLLAWLACERERQPFTIAALETELSEIRVGALQLRVRPDRIDRLADGTHLLIDYKTGKVRGADWDGERPDEPQLPLYALFGGVERVSGVAFAQIRADVTKLIARAEDAAAQVSERLGKASEKSRFDDEVRDNWSEALLALAGHFAAGDARVNPREGRATCRYCPLAGLCRVHGSGRLEPADDDLEDTADG